MIIGIIMILYFISYFYSIDNGGVHSMYPCPNTDTCVIIRIPYIPLYKRYIIYESIRQITITLFIINFMNNLF